MPFATAFGGDTDLLQESIRTTMAGAQEVNERAVRAARTAGTAGLDNWEKSVHSLVSMQERAAEATQIAWFRRFVGVQASFTRTVSGAYFAVARDLLTRDLLPR